MVSPGERVLVAVSGGPDSVALLGALVALAPALKIDVCAAHFNHHLRGEEAERDQRCAQLVATTLGVRCIVGDAVDLCGHPNVEARARTQRYAFLASVAEAEGCAKIATGHTMDDQAETLLMRLLRGTGWDGMACIQPVRDGRIVRPLIDCSRRQVIRFLTARWLPSCEDSSNRDTRLLRNRVRLDVLPLLRAINPNVVHTLASTAEILSGEATLLEAAASLCLPAMAMSVGSVLREPQHERSGSHWIQNPKHLPVRPEEPPSFGGVSKGGCGEGRQSLAVASLVTAPPALRGRVVRMWLRTQRGDLRRVTAAHIRAIVDLALGERPGARVRLPGGERIVREYEQLRWKTDETPAAAEPQREIVPGSSVSLASGWSITAELLDAHRLDPPRSRNLWEMAADAATIPTPLVVRGARPGDRVRPLGLRGSRKLQDIFVDRKLPRDERWSFPVVEAAGEVLWVPGIVRSSAALVTSDTCSALRLIARKAGIAGG